MKLYKVVIMTYLDPLNKKYYSQKIYDDLNSLYTIDYDNKTICINKFKKLDGKEFKLISTEIFTDVISVICEAAEDQIFKMM